MAADKAPRADLIRVLICDNSWIVTQLLADALRRETDLEIIGGALDLPTILAQTSAQSIDVALVSARWDDDPLKGLEIVRELRAAKPLTRSIVLLETSKPESVFEAFRAGARGLFSPGQSVATLSKCIRSVHQGQIWANSEQLTAIVDALAAGPRVKAIDAKGFTLLSKREMDVVRSLAEGLPNRDIAQKLGLSQHTVKNYLFRIFDKLGVSSRLELLFMTLSQANSAHNGLSESDPKLATPEKMNGGSLALYQRAAEEGVLNAQVALAEMYANGTGTPVDISAAYTWFSVCEQTCMKVQLQAAAAKRGLASSLTPEQQVAAEVRASEFVGKDKNEIKRPEPVGTKVPTPDSTNRRTLYAVSD